MPLVLGSKSVGRPLFFVVETDREAVLGEAVNAEHRAVLGFQVDRAGAVLLAGLGDIAHVGENRLAQSERERLVGDNQADAGLLVERLAISVVERHRNGIGEPGADQRRDGLRIAGLLAGLRFRRANAAGGDKQKQRGEGRNDTRNRTSHGDFS